MKPLCYFTIGLIAGIAAIGAAAPDSTDHIQISIALPVERPATVSGVDMDQLDCMAQNIFYEARGESAKGKVMVGMVVMQRVKSPHFPKTICGVVKQANRNTAGHVIRNECSFSWYCDGQDHSIDFDSGAVRQEWDDSYTIAKRVMQNKIKLKIDMDGVTHYHSGQVHPYWARDHKDYKLVAKIGHHLFYRWKKATMPKWEPSPQVAMN